MVPPRSDRISRVPPYSRTMVHPYPYRAVTVCGAPFQTLPVRQPWPLAWSAFARRYWRSRCCCPFLRLLRCFSSPGSPPMAMDSHRATASRWVAPFGDPRITGARPSPRLFAACHVLHRLSVPRHPPDALLVLRPRPAPSTPRPSCRGQMSEVRCQTAASDHAAERVCLVLRHPLLDLDRPGPLCANFAPPMLAHRQTHTHAQARPHPPQRVMAGPASRSRLASRFQQIRGQRTEDRPDGPSRPLSVTTRGPDARRPSGFCPLFTVIWHLHLVGLGRFERPTSRLSGVRSDQLSYRPKFSRSDQTGTGGQTTDATGRPVRAGSDRPRTLGSDL